MKVHSKIIESHQICHVFTVNSSESSNNTQRRIEIHRKSIDSVRNQQKFDSFSSKLVRLEQRLHAGYP
ncbi:hypothetical protein Hanom_Chr05g00420131 [Helianthus anomalus]